MSSYLSSNSAAVFRMSRNKDEKEDGKKTKIGRSSSLKTSLSSSSGSGGSSSRLLSKRSTTSKSSSKCSSSKDRMGHLKSSSDGILRRDSLDLAEKKSSARRRTSSLEKAADSVRDLMSKYGYKGVGKDDYEDYLYDEAEYEEETKLEETNSKGGEKQPVKGILSTSKPDHLRNFNRGKRRVTFNKNATLHYMPAHEMVSARRSRKGMWEPAPEHDELWDGDLQDFRRVPLTTEQLTKVMRQKEQDYEYGSFYSMNYTYPPASGYNSYGTDDFGMDELDSYMDDLSFASSFGTGNVGHNYGSGSSNKSSRCYVCTPVAEWKTREVAAFIKDHIVGGDFFCMNFEQNHVDGRMFLQMEERDLRNIGIKRGSDRQAILGSKNELLHGSLSHQTCLCDATSTSSSSASLSSSRDVLDRHSKFLEQTKSFLHSL